MKMSPPVPILRSFDEPKAKDFYIGFLEFDIDWEHRFDKTAPLYMQISKGNCVIHLSEHHGDASPGASLRIDTDELDNYQALLINKHYKHARPGIEKMPWRTRDMVVTDPFGNRLIFTEDASD